MKKLLPIFLILSILAIVYGAKMYQYEDNPALNSEIENIYLDTGTSKKRIAELEEGIKVKVGSFTCPADTGNYSVTGLGFKPRYVDFMIGMEATAYSITANGWMDYNGNQGAVSTSGINTGAEYCERSITRCLHVVDTVGSIFIYATFVSMNNDGFTINFGAVNVTYTIMWKACR